MAEYKTPIGRKAFKAKMKRLFQEWLDTELDDSGDTSTVWDDADDTCARAYQDAIEDDKSHKEAQKAATMRFWEIMRDSLPGQMEELFEGLTKNAS